MPRPSDLRASPWLLTLNQVSCLLAVALQDAVVFKAFGKDSIMTMGADHYEVCASSRMQLTFIC